MANYLRLNEERMKEYGLEAHQVKEMEGRTAEDLFFGDRFIHDYSKGKFDYYDALATAVTIVTNTFVHEYKAYGDPDHIRRHDKFPNYYVDAIKLKRVKDKAMREGRIPLLIVFFYDCVCVWDLNKAPWEDTVTYVDVNAEGVNYGRRRETSGLAILYFEKEKGMILQKELPDGFWDDVKRKINEDYPGLYE